MPPADGPRPASQPEARRQDEPMPTRHEALAGGACSHWWAAHNPPRCGHCRYCLRAEEPPPGDPRKDIELACRELLADAERDLTGAERLRRTRNYVSVIRDRSSSPSAPASDPTEDEINRVLRYVNDMCPTVASLKEFMEHWQAQGWPSAPAETPGEPTDDQRMLPHAAAWLRDLAEDGNITDKQTTDLRAIADQLDRLEEALRSVPPSVDNAERGKEKDT